MGQLRAGTTLVKIDADTKRLLGQAERFGSSEEREWHENHAYLLGIWMLRTYPLNRAYVEALRQFRGKGPGVDIRPGCAARGWVG